MPYRQLLILVLRIFSGLVLPLVLALLLQSITDISINSSLKCSVYVFIRSFSLSLSLSLYIYIYILCSIKNISLLSNKVTNINRVISLFHCNYLSLWHLYVCLIYILLNSVISVFTFESVSVSVKFWTCFSQFFFKLCFSVWFYFSFS